VRRADVGNTARKGATGLGLGQLFALIFGFLVTSALIFLFGIWVGRDITERRLASQERVVRIPVPAQPTEVPDGKASTDVDLTFYQQLKEKAERRLQETAAASTPSAVTARVAQAVAPATPREPGRGSVVPSPTARSKHDAAERTDEWADKGWTVQVNATTNPQQATDLAHSLRAKGYDAYTVQAPMRGQTWYRVRVGRFSARDKAKELETKLKDSEGMENAYVTPQ
jgi:cell division septation protein DedD